MFTGRPAFAAHCAALLLLLASSAYAQSTKAELLGVVRDPAGLPVQGAVVEMTNAATGLAVSTTTGSEGAYQFLAMPAGL